MTVTERVQRGAALLDAKEPGWRDRISPAELDIESCSRCVIGQVFGIEENATVKWAASDAWSGRCAELGLDWWDRGNCPWSHGFAAHTALEYNALRDEWVRYLKGESE